ncbi:MAG: DNA polymerase III subunit delta' C-terminal domain-containing protein [Candidatus Dasytiphilus stammeri]
MVDNQIKNYWYPWLNYPYQQIIKQYHIKRGHHTLLLYAPYGLGIEVLLWKISCLLMCSFTTTNFQSCGKCHSCQLMNSMNHPDLYVLDILKKEKSSVGIEDIREIYDDLYQKSKLGTAKILWILQPEKLTESAVNLLLKIVEDPPTNTWFFFYSFEKTNIPIILRSRCQAWHIISPSEIEGLKWLKNNNGINKCPPITLIAALRLSYGAPIAALNLLKSQDWPNRKKIYDEIMKNLFQLEIIKLLPLMNNENVAKQIEWLCTLLLDALKLKYSDKKHIINIDYYELVQRLSNNLSNEILLKILRQWCICRDHILHITSISRELLLIKHLIIWNQLMQLNVNRS